MDKIKKNRQVHHLRGSILMLLWFVLFVAVFHLSLSLSNAQSSPHSLNSESQLEAINHTFARISESNAYVEDLNYGDLKAVSLPIGMKRTISGMDVTIAINRFALGPEHSELGVYAKAVIPQGEEGRRLVLFFGVEGIKGSHTGGLLGEVKLSLLNDVDIPFNGGNTRLVLKGQPLNRRGLSESNSYMTITCDGFKNLSLDAEVHFPTSLLVKSGGQTNSLASGVSSGNTSEQVVGHFQTVIDSWDDLVVSLDLPSFEIKGLKDYVFSLDDVVLDLSSTRNAPTVVFPEEYERDYLPSERSLWRGVYARNVSVTLPKAFSQASFSGKGLVIDDYGITGIFSADSILPLDRGSADGWKFSVDKFVLQLIASQLVGSEFKGRLGLPFKGQSTTLTYEGFMQPHDRYTLLVRTDSVIDFSMFNAQAQLDPNSYVKLNLTGDRFVPEAVLHGQMSLGGHTGREGVSSSEGVRLSTLKFRNLRLTTQAPYISVEYFGYEGEAKLGSFPLSIHKLELGSTRESEIRLALGAGLTLSKDLFSGKTEIALLASYRNHVWHYEGLEVSAIDLDATIAGRLALTGKLHWHRGDAIYGNGFAGDINLALSLSGGKSPSQGVSIKARSAFGRKDGNSYWYADGMASFSHGVPLFGPMTLNGIGAALTYGVRAEGAPSDGADGRFNNTQYIPDASKGLGFKASTIFTINKATHGEAALEMLFSRSGGLSMVGLYGYAEFPNNGGGEKASEERLAQQKRVIPSNLGEQMKQRGDFSKILDALSPSTLPSALKDASISGSLFMQLDLDNSSLHAVSRVYVSSPGGLIKGVGPQGLAGMGVLHIDPKEWYLHLGTPDTPIGLRMSVGNIIAVESSAYLMAGSRIPAMPPPPKEVASLIGQDLGRLSLGRNLDALSTGKGFAFGANLAVHTGDLRFAIMYANFKTGLGFDVMLKDYGTAQCRGRSGTIGLDGWYALGQAYAYLEGELGVKIKLWFIRMRIPVIRGGAATLLQAGLPDPTFFKGYLGVHLDVLGLIKGRARFKLSIGEECDVIIPGSSPIEEPMINDLSPSGGEMEVNVFAMPEATFNIAMGRSFEGGDEDGSSKTYRISLRSFEVKGKDGVPIRGKLVWASDSTKVRFVAKEVLPPNTELTAVVRVGFEEWQGDSWQTVMSSGEPAVEEKIHTFTTGGAPNEIPLANVVYTYPVVGQSFFLLEESRKGYVQLRMGQKYLFEKGFDYRLIFTNEEGERVSTDFRYNEEDNRLEFAIPRLKPQKPYTLSLAYTAKAEDMETSLPETPTKQGIEGEDFTGRIGGDRARQGVATDLEQSILSYGFGTSRHKTFKDKMQTIKIKAGFASYDEASAFPLELEVASNEAFDEAEVLGVDKTRGQALVQLKAPLEEDYFTKMVLPLVYEGYPYAGVRLSHREEQPYGAPPHSAFAPNTHYLGQLANEEINAKHFRFPFIYLPAKVAMEDFSDLQGSMVNARSLISDQIYERFAMGSLKILPYGKYRAVVSYVLPDGRVSSTTTIMYNNNLKLYTDQ